jgi:hypothetical protein
MADFEREAALGEPVAENIGRRRTRQPEGVF